MVKPIYNKGFNGWAQLGLLLVLIGVGLVVGSLLSAGIWKMMTGQSIASMATEIKNPANNLAVKVIQLATTLVVMFIPAVLFARIVYQNPKQALGLNHAIQPGILLLCIAFLLSSGPLIDALTTLNRNIPLPENLRATFDSLEKAYADQIQTMGKMKNFSEYLSTLLLIAAAPAVFEELLFRAVLQNILVRWWKKPLLAIVVTAIIFSAFHGSWYGFLPRIALGVILGLVFYITDNIWYPVLLHFLNNAAIVTYMYYLNLMGKPLNFSDTMTNLPWWVAIFSTILAFLIYKQLLAKGRSEKPPEIFFDRSNPFDQPNTIA